MRYNVLSDIGTSKKSKTSAYYYFHSHINKYDDSVAGWSKSYSKRKYLSNTSNIIIWIKEER